jgi:hypothetical protein
MINTQDARVGNYVYFGEKTPAQIKCILKSSFIIEDLDTRETFKVLAKEINPVPLDDKWLERLPMVKRPDATDHYGGWLIRVHPFHWIRIKDSGWESGVGRIDLTYVHQLQNLYKILTNTELY